MSIQSIGLLLFALGVLTWAAARSALMLPFRDLRHGTVPRLTQRFGLIAAAIGIALFLGPLLVVLAYNAVTHSQ